MTFGVLGTGMVGKALSGKLAGLGHEVMMGTRAADNADVQTWIASSGSGIRLGSFSEAAAFGETLVTCTAGTTSLQVLRSLARKDLAGKLLIDVSNPLDFSKTPAVLTICNSDSLGETIQREFPELRVVKALNTCNCRVMVDPGRVPGEHDLFLAGNDSDAKAQVTSLLRTFGWRSILDIGDITGARATESMMLIWLRLYGKFASADLNYRIARPPAEASAK